MTDLILVVVAVFLAIKLFSMFGQKRGVDKQDFEARQSYDGTINSQNKSSIKEVELKLEKITDPMVRLKVLYPTFNKKKFLKEAETAYETILNLYASGNTHELSDLLNIEMMQKFAYAITQREEKGLKCKVNILKINDVVLEKVSFEKNTIAKLLVLFDTEVIHYTSDHKGNISTGHKSKVDNRKDIWTFSKDVNFPSTAWKLVALDHLF